MLVIGLSLLLSLTGAAGRIQWRLVQAQYRGEAVRQVAIVGSEGPRTVLGEDAQQVADALLAGRYLRTEGKGRVQPDQPRLRLTLSYPGRGTLVAESHEPGSFIVEATAPIVVGSPALEQLLQQLGLSRR